MAINFTTNIEQYTMGAQRTRGTQFVNYASKKQLQNAGILSESELQFLTAIKNTFTFAVHNEKRYVAITLYYASTKKYGFIIVDLQNKAIAQVESIKQAKIEILALINEQ